MPEIAAALGIPLTSVENYFRAARKRLASILEEQVRSHVARYSPEAQREEEWRSEWSRLGDHLTTHGSLEQAVRQACEGNWGLDWQSRKSARISATLSRVFPPSSGTNAPPTTSV